MHILHVSNDFAGSKVHANLYQALAKKNIRQTIYCPVRSASLIGKNDFAANETKVIYDFVIKPFHRYVYHIKRESLFKSLIKKVDLGDVDLCHAATLFSDGGLAYKIYKQYHIPYVVAVRGTDINGFLNKLPNTWLAGRKILRNAQRIFFISKALMDKFVNHKVIKPILSEIEDKMFLIPNGISDFFIDNVYNIPHCGHKVLYVGDFSNNKNVLRLGQAVLNLREEEDYNDVTLTLVGGGKATGDEVQAMIDSHPQVVRFLGPIYDKRRLSEVFRSHSVFAMPSIAETFGLVYIEALTQNLPVVYTKGQGIDGLFDETVGIGVNPLSIDGIKNAIKTILSSPEKYSNSSIDFENFRWSNVAERYYPFYDDIISNNNFTKPIK